MVYQYANEGDLRQYLSKNFTTLIWEQKLDFLISIVLNLLTFQDA